MIQEIENFSLAKHEGKYEKWPKKTKLFFDNSYTGTLVSGYMLEKQFKVSDCYLLILSYDCPYEEANNFVLLDSSFKILGEKSLFEMYSSYLLESTRVKSGSVIELEYNGNRCVELSLFRKKGGLFARNIILKPCENSNS